ncbi:hypothetical protein [Paenibacillus faecalis]|uniref:hypothetical protein n=1 Tax=Paenibacillus faecalis TaxID=2079532 RepID=UPI000D0E6305|nr:hypothetical protein [Paenibacillus faecalis]
MNHVFIAEVYEIKPISYHTNAAYNASGKRQLNSYINGINVNGFRGKDGRARKGTRFNPNGLVIPSPFNSKKEIVFYTFPEDPGMITMEKETVGLQIIRRQNQVKGILLLGIL